MSKKKEEQVVYKTKYDKKMAEREQQKKKDAKSLFLARVIGVVLVAAVVAAILVPVVMNIVKKNEALNGTYVKINDHELTKLEYDYYYNTTVNSYISTYGSFLQYMNLDTAKDFSTQQYTDDMTWKDYFDQMTVEQIKQTYALLDDAEANGFSYDAMSEYDSYVASMKESAETTGYTVQDYYHSYFGSYATEKNVASFIQDGIIASAYYDQLTEDHKPSTEEVQNYYQENKNSYDQVDYQSYLSSCELSEDATEEEKTADGETRLKDVQEQLAAMEAGKDLALELEPTEGAKISAVPSVASEWLFDESRQEGDIEAFLDESTADVYVVQFVKRYYDAENDETISQTLAQQTVTEYVYGLAEQYTVTDVKGELNYLTISAAETDTNSDTATDAEE